MIRLIGVSSLVLTAVAALSACAPTTTTLAEFNARRADQRMMSQGLGSTVAQPPVTQRSWTRGAVR